MLLTLSAFLHVLALAAILPRRPEAPGPTQESEVTLIWQEQGQGDGEAAEAAVPPPSTPAEALEAPVAPQPPAAQERQVPAVVAPGAFTPAPELPAPPPPAPASPLAGAIPPVPARGASPSRPVARPNPQAVPADSAPASLLAPRMEGRPAAAAPEAAPSPGSGPAQAEGAIAPPRPRGDAHNAPPRYPVASRRNGEEGRVVLRVSVGADGRVIALAIIRSSGFVALDEAALRAVRDWHFEPARQDGRAVFSDATVAITFRLQEGPAW